MTALVWQSITVAKYTQPSQVGMYVISPTSLRPGAVGVGEHRGDQQLQPLPARGGRRRRPIAPLVVARTRHLQPFAHLHDRVLDRAAGRGGRLLRIDELIPHAHRYSWAKKAAAFPRKSFFNRSSRTSRSNSRSHARADTASSGSSPAWSRRYAATQFPKVPSTMPSSPATCAIGRDVSITAFTASSRYSGVNFRRRSNTRSLHPRRGS